MDKIDRKLIAELQRDGRLTNQELSERVSLSPSPCLRRLRQLEQDGVIEGYTALVNQEACGFHITAFISIRLEKQNDKTIRAFENGIRDLDEIVDITIDYLLQVLSPSLKDYEIFIRDKLSRTAGIGTLETHFAFGQVKRSTVFPGFD